VICTIPAILWLCLFDPYLHRFISKCKDKPSETYVTRFTDGSKVEMNSEEVKMATELFRIELEKLVVEAKVPKADASNTGVHVAVDSKSQGSLRCPVLAEGQENDTEEYECVFEEEYDGEVPKVLVGLEFPKRSSNWYSQRTRDHIKLPFWQFVLRKLSEKVLEEGTALSSRDLFNLEKAEQRSGN